MKFHQYLTEDKLPKNLHTTNFVHTLTHYAVNNKKFSTFHKAYKKHIADFFDDINHFTRSGGKTFGQSWMTIVTNHIYDEDFGFQEREVQKLWDELSRRHGDLRTKIKHTRSYDFFTEIKMKFETYLTEITIQKAAKQLAKKGYKLGAGKTNLKTMTTSYEVTDPKGKVTIMTAKEIMKI